jgi:hypothetical protein
MVVLRWSQKSEVGGRGGRRIDRLIQASQQPATILRGGTLSVIQTGLEFSLDGVEIGLGRIQTSHCRQSSRETIALFQLSACHGGTSSSLGQTRVGTSTKSTLLKAIAVAHG